MKLELICGFYIIIMIGYSLFIMFKYVKFFKRNSKSYSHKLKNNKKLVIAIPCLREPKTKVLLQSLQRLRHLKNQKVLLEHFLVLIASILIC